MSLPTAEASALECGAAVLGSVGYLDLLTQSQHKQQNRLEQQPRLYSFIRLPEHPRFYSFISLFLNTRMQANLTLILGQKDALFIFHRICNPIESI